MELRDPFIARFFDDRWIEPIHDVDTAFDRGRDEPTKLRIHFWCSAGQVKGFNLAPFRDEQREFHRFAVHEFFSPRPGIDVAMDAAEVAQIAEIELQRIDALASDLRERVALQLEQGVMHEESPGAVPCRWSSI